MKIYWFTKQELQTAILKDHSLSAKTLWCCMQHGLGTTHPNDGSINQKTRNGQGKELTSTIKKT